MDWNHVPDNLRERYQNISNVDYGQLKISFLEEMNLDVMPIDLDSDSRSYEVFANEFNSIMLTAHLFENLVVFEERWQEREGYHDFQIKIPEVYFQHPSLNKEASISKERAKNISDSLEPIKRKMNYANDQSFVMHNLHKLEFISVFSHIESYIEGLQVEFLGKTKVEAAAYMRKIALPIAMAETLNAIDPKILEVIEAVEKETIKFMSFCHRLRNLHTHNLGITTKWFFEKGLEEEFLCHDTYAESSEPVKDYARLNFAFCDYIFEVGRHLNLSTISQPFRLLAREIVFTSETFCKVKKT